MTAIESMTNQLIDTDIKPNITVKQLEEFDRAMIFYALQDLRYGQAFCQHFGIANSSPLYHFKSKDTARRWIQNNYLNK